MQGPLPQPYDPWIAASPRGMSPQVLAVTIPSKRDML
jgi:hypothetical protein